MVQLIGRLKIRKRFCEGMAQFAFTKISHINNRNKDI